MKAYLHLLEDVLLKGELRDTRNSITITRFGLSFSHNLQKGFPLLTTKKMSLLSIAAELAGFIRGFDNAAQFRKLGCNVWNANANEGEWVNNPYRKGEDDLGRIYGVQWRDWGKEVDQLTNLINEILHNPHSRRLLVSAWNAGELEQMALPPCHVMFQCFVSQGFLDLQMYQRSADVFLGVPYNIASYALLMHLIGHVTGLKPRHLKICFGDIHLYEDHRQAALQQLSRIPRKLPNLTVSNTLIMLDDFEPNHVTLNNYDPYDRIVAPMIV